MYYVYLIRSKKCPNILPEILLTPLIIAAKQKGVYSKYVTDNLTNKSDNFFIHNHKLFDSFKERVSINRIISYYKINKIPFSPLHDYYNMIYTPIFNKYYQEKFYVKL